MTASGAFLLGAAAIRRLASPNPFFNLPFLFKRNTLIVGAALFSFRFVLLAVAVLIPAYLGAIQNYRQLEISPVMWWIILPQLVMGWISVQLMKRFDGRLLLAVGFGSGEITPTSSSSCTAPVDIIRTRCRLLIRPSIIRT